MRGRWLLLLVSLGILLALLGVGGQPGPRGESDVVMGRGPAVTRYDAANDTTLAVFKCSHWWCDRGHVLEGDARERVAGRGVLLRPVGEDPWREVPVEPVPMPYALDPVTRAYAGPFAIVPIWPRLGALVAGLAMAGAGAALLLARRGLASRVAAVVAPVGGVALGTFGASLGDGSVLLFLLAPLPLGAAALLALRPRTRPLVLPLLLAVVLMLVALSEARPYLPSEPSV